mmetsp:Transcript_50562/g.132323  ORF Transcript_50562/g.132323 Transcript_50562/m.132323 type:complete len:118 (+) Transcript_50562:3-356(+)
MSVLLYLTEGPRGGETTFFPSGETEADEEAARICVSPQLGAALCFWHGRHPMSPLHEGSPLRAECSSAKYVIRTEVMYFSEAEVVQSDNWSSTSYVNAMLHASKVWSDTANDASNAA